MKQIFFKTTTINLRLLLCLVILMATLSTVYAQERETKPQKKEKKRPPQSNSQIAQGSPIPYLNTLEINYGLINQGSNATRSVYMTNDGDAPLIITSARGSNKSISVDYPTTPIIKGQPVEIKISYYANIAGAFSKSVSISTNASIEPKVVAVFGEVKEVNNTLSLHFSNIYMGECGRNADCTHEPVAGKVEVYLIDKTTGRQVIGNNQNVTIWNSPTHSLTCSNYNANNFRNDLASGEGIVSRGNVDRTFNFTVNQKNYQNNQYELVVRFNLGNPHKDNDFASTGYHWLTTGNNMIEARRTLNKNGSYLIGPYQTSSDRCHQYWLLFDSGL